MQGGKQDVTGVRKKLELRRQSDDLVYVFEKEIDTDGGIVYWRQDRKVSIMRRGELGWVVWDQPSQSVVGRPWDTLPRQQGDEPPAEDWVSKKGPRSYVYRLGFIDD